MQRLREMLEFEQRSLSAHSGAMCLFSETGPVGISLIRDLVRVIGDQDMRIRLLERQIEEILHSPANPSTH